MNTLMAEFGEADAGLSSGGVSDDDTETYALTVAFYATFGFPEQDKP
ncbi:MAG: hypothetical protein JXA89_11075 [Anaerolineae bacterium]|nr:hypothetical protein [Anaerolineae bacterium]